MLVTETGIPIRTTTSSLIDIATMDTTTKKSRRIGFADQVATVVAHVALEDPGRLWYSKLDLKLFKSKAKHLSNHLRESQSVLVKEIELAYETTRNKDIKGTELLLPSWSSLGSSRRGLERFVLAKDQRRDQAQEVKASRSVVLNLQCLFRRNPMAAQMADQHAEIMGQQYYEFTRPALLLAQVYGKADAEAVAPYYHDEHVEEEDILEDVLSDEDCESLWSAASFDTRESRDSLSAKKLKRRKNRDESSKKGRMAPERSSSAKGSKTSKSQSRTKSPLRRLVSDLSGSVNKFR
jgi:hypothetical protein